MKMDPTFSTTRSLPSLLSLSVHEFVKILDLHHDDVEKLPTNVKEKLLNLMCKRGLINDENISKMVTARTRSLDLSWSNVSDRALRSIRVCKNLRKIDINCTKGVRESVTSEGFQVVARSCPYLQAVGLRRCVNITDQAIVALAQSCKQLVELNIGGCKQITDASLVAVSQSCKFLRSINFSSTKVTDNGVETLARGVCDRSLNEIHMSHCIHLTNQSIEAIVMFCPNIQTLIFDGCPCITESGRQILQEAQSNMKQLTWTVYMT